MEVVCKCVDEHFVDAFLKVVGQLMEVFHHLLLPLHHLLSMFNHLCRSVSPSLVTSFVNADGLRILR